MAVRLTSQFPPEVDPFAADSAQADNAATLVSIVERLAVVEQIGQPVEAWPEKCDRRVESLEQRVRHLEMLVHRLVNGDAPHKRLEVNDQDAMG